VNDSAASNLTIVQLCYCLSEIFSILHRS